MGIFGTSGIRDLCPGKITPDLVMSVANILCSKEREVAVAYDSRRTGQMLKSAVISGATMAGANAFDLGVCPTPTLSYFSQLRKCPAIMITASHNPYEYNGIKLFSLGLELSSKKEEEIESALNAKTKTQVEWNLCGQVFDAHSQASDAHIRTILSNIDVSSIKKAKPKVAIDCANMAASEISPLTLSKCGCKVVSQNCNSGEICLHPPEPKEGNLDSLCELVASSGSDLGIAHDGDADRAIIIDENGKILGLDAQLAIAVNYTLSKNEGAKIISTVESSLSLRNIVEKNGGTLEITPVGSMKVAAKMRQTKAIFGGEPCGEYIFSNAVGSPDGIMTGAFFAQIFSEEGKLSALCSKVEKYPIQRDKISCSNSKKPDAMKKIGSKWPFSTPNKSDGLRSDENWGWVLVRPSGTEPYIRITIEAKTQGELDKNLEKISRIVKDACV